MRGDIRVYTINGVHWLGVKIGTKLHLITYLGRGSERIRP